MSNKVRFLLSETLFHCGVLGLQYTWKHDNLYQRLDPCLFNEELERSYPLARVIYLDRIRSDHCPNLFELNFVVCDGSSRLFSKVPDWNYNVFGSISKRKKGIDGVIERD
ncbi:hypothetical protein GQ457_04G025240 [Hibiscus cannabinus]